MLSSSLYSPPLGAAAAFLLLLLLSIITTPMIMVAAAHTATANSVPAQLLPFGQWTVDCQGEQDPQSLSWK